MCTSAACTLYRKLNYRLLWAAPLPLHRKLNYRFVWAAPLPLHRKLNHRFLWAAPLSPQMQSWDMPLSFLSDQKIWHMRATQNVHGRFCLVPLSPQCKVEAVASILFFVRARRLSRQHCNLGGKGGKQKRWLSFLSGWPHPCKGIRFIIAHPYIASW